MNYKTTDMAQDTVRMGIPVVSVIIPTYNRAQLIGPAISSVLGQSFQNWELFLVDDASNDNTEEVVRSFGDGRIHYLRHETNKGANEARNTGIKAARGEYIGFLDSDDEWLPEKLEKQLEVFQKSELRPLGVVYCGHAAIRNGHEQVSLPRYRGWLYEDLLMLKRVTATSGMLVSRNCFEASTLFDSSLPAAQEYDLLLRLSTQYQMDFAPTLLYRGQSHSGDRISKPSNHILAREALLKKYQKELQARPRARAMHHFQAAVAYFRYGDLSGVRRHLIGAISANPRKFKWLPLLAGSFCGAQVFAQIYSVYSSASGTRKRISNKLENTVQEI